MFDGRMFEGAVYVAGCVLAFVFCLGAAVGAAVALAITWR